MMERKHYEFILESRSPIAHHSESIGNTAIAMRRKIRQPDGSFASVPIVTADTMRHGIREAAAYALLDAAGMLDAGALSEGALRLLFAGGMVTGKGDASAVRLDDFRELSDLVPPLALLGGCADNRVIPGRLNVDDAVLICDETAHQLPEWVAEWMREHSAALDTSRAHVVEEQRVRMDPALDPGKRRLLGAGDAANAEARLLTSEGAHESGDAIAKAESKSTMMPRRYETIVAGALFYWSVSATCFSDLDVATFHAMLARFLYDARVGGKKGTGHGQIIAVTGRQCRVLRPSDTPENLDVALAAHGGDLFRKHVQARADRIREKLSTVNA